MSGSPGSSVSFPEVAGEIVRLARVEGTRIGVTARSLGIPVFAAFPAVPVHRITGPFAELAGAGLSQEIVDQWTVTFPDGLNALQLRAVNDFGVLNGNSLLVVAPTSSGKTLVGELAAIRAVTAGKKAVFLKALQPARPSNARAPTPP